MAGSVVEAVNRPVEAMNALLYLVLLYSAVAGAQAAEVRTHHRSENSLFKRDAILDRTLRMSIPKTNSR